MQTISKTRIFIVLFVTLIALLATIPTARYYMHINQKLVPKSPRPTDWASMPAKDNVKALAEWQQQHPNSAKWVKDNPAYVVWDAKADELRQAAIPMGLDLIGGVDVTLVLDRDKAIATDITNTMESLRDDFNKSKINATFLPDLDNTGFTVKVNNAKDARSAANLLKNYELRLTTVPTEAQLVAGTRLTLESKSLDERLNKAIEGARKGITDRVDTLGVTQPRISLQGTDRIRVQVPGEKDPDRLISTVIQPAVLEFHLVDERNDQIIGPDGKVRPGTSIPLGTMVAPGKLGHTNKTTQQIEYTNTNFLLVKQAALTGKYLRRADVQFNPSDLENPIQVSLEFDSEGARIFGQVTGANVGRRLAVMLDGVVRSAPRLNEAITGGRAQITGGFSNEEATDLSQILKAGSLPAPLKIESKRTVGASLGNDSIMSGVKALVWGSIIITIMMVLYYGTAGVISIIALVLNILIVLAIMWASKATLTLSGIGGLLLTIGMAVDTNILIYERIREEVNAGHPLRQAIYLGQHRAFAVILDSHLTTLFSAMVLLQFTEGSVFGFALTMTYGLIANLFTGLTVTYTLCMLWFQWRGKLSLGKLRIFHNTNFDFIKTRWFSWSISNVFMLVALIAVVVNGGLKYGVDFAGGLRSEVKFAKPVDESKLRHSLSEGGFKDPNLQKVTDATTPNLYIIDVNLLPAPGAKTASAGQVENTEKRFSEVMNKNFDGNYTIRMQSSFGAQTSQEFASLAILVTLLASCAILLYLWFRFELVFGIAAVTALLHDMVIVFLLSSLCGVQVNLELVAAMMVLMGFSVNDTIVVFDRIREDARLEPTKDFGEICNLAMNQSLSRTILTSGTVFLAVLTLFLVGGEGLRAFSIVYLLGTIFGTYSSDFIAAPIVYQWNKHTGNKLMQMLTAKKRKKDEAKPIHSAGAATRPGSARLNQ